MKKENYYIELYKNKGVDVLNKVKGGGVGGSNDRNNNWNTYWTWTFDGFHHPEESVYQGELNIKKLRKNKSDI